MAAPSVVFIFWLIFAQIQNAFQKAIPDIQLHTFCTYIYIHTSNYNLTKQDDFLQQQKASYEGADSDVKFVSTNDCVVSTVLNSLKCDFALMAINFRGKVEGCDDDGIYM